MKPETIAKLEDCQSKLYDWIGEVESMVMGIDENESIQKMIEVFEKVESHIPVAREIIKEIEEL